MAIEENVSVDAGIEGEAEPQIAEGAYYVLTLAFLIGLVNLLDRQILAILIEPIKQDLGVSDTAMGFLAGFGFSIFYVLAGLPMARWIDIGNRRNILTICMVAWSGATALCGVASSYIQLFIFRIGVAVGEAAGNPALVSLLSDLFPPKKRATAYGVYWAGTAAGIFFGLFLGGWIADNIGWRMAFMLVAIPGVLLAIVVRFTMVEPKRGTYDTQTTDEKPSIWEVLSYLVKRPTYRYQVVGSALHTLAMYAILAWSATFLIRVHGLSATEVGLWFGLSLGIGFVLANLLGGVFADWAGSRHMRWYMGVPALVCVLSLPFIFGFLMSPSSTVAIAFALPMCFFSGSAAPAMVATTQAISKPNMRAVSYSASYTVSAMLGIGGGPFLVGL